MEGAASAVPFVFRGIESIMIGSTQREIAAVGTRFIDRAGERRSGEQALLSARRQNQPST